jgi:amino acid transporter
MKGSVLARKNQWLRTVKAVAWSFVGLRQGSEFQEDMQKINPVHLVMVGIAAAAVLVGGLMFLVQWAVVAAK